jgi:Family of unknown function (DUF5670)
LTRAPLVAAPILERSSVAASLDPKRTPGRKRAGHRRGSGDPASRVRAERPSMLYTIAVVMILLWLLGLVSSYTMGGFIHILLVIAIIMLLVRLIGGRRAIDV